MLILTLFHKIFCEDFDHKCKFVVQTHNPFLKQKLYSSEFLMASSKEALFSGENRMF